MLLDEFIFEDPEIDLDLIEESEDAILESNISTNDIGLKSGRGKSRYIMITGSGMAKHAGRMKVSVKGKRINPNNYNDYISIYRKNQNEITHEGNLKNIDMDNKEYKIYVDLFIRNENLIQIVKFMPGKYDDHVDQRLIDDEQRRLSGMTVIRDMNGNAKIYDNKGILLYEENIMGKRI